jgi:hypothetical protein
MDDLMNNPAAISRMVYDSEAYQIYNRLLTLDTNLFVFEKNYRDLKLAISKFTSPENIDLLWNQQEAQTILNHIIRFFHNFLASAKTLVDHTRLLIREWYKETEFIDEYQSQIQIRFSKNPLSTFIEDLRNYTLHYSLPLCGVSIEVTTDKETEEQSENVAFFVEKETLMKWSNWDKGKAFLEIADERIFVEEIADLYHEQVLDFHVWMNSRLEQIHAAELNWLTEMNSRVQELLSINRNQT